MKSRVRIPGPLLGVCVLTPAIASVVMILLPSKPPPGSAGASQSYANRGPVSPGRAESPSERQRLAREGAASIGDPVMVQSPMLEQSLESIRSMAARVGVRLPEPEPVEQQTPEPEPQEVRDDRPEIELGGIMGGRRPVAIINGRPSVIGEEPVRGWRLTRIDQPGRSVTLSSRSGEELTVEMRGR